MVFAKRFAPGFVRRFLATPRGRRARYFGLSHHCPVCGSRLRTFIDYGRIHILKAEECPVCGAHRRHRLMWLYFRDKLRLGTCPRFSLLHVAPEAAFIELFRSLQNIDYVSADISSPLAMVKMDLTAIEYPSNCFDAIYCSHVLEHIPDDRRALNELHRVLKPGGWAILQVPLDLSRETTLEDPTVKSEEARERFFWQFDHVRLYGRDYRKRLEEAGFAVTVDDFVRRLPQRDVQWFGLDRSEDIYVCRKAPDAS